MTDKKTEALKLALEALGYWHVRDKFDKQTSNAITAIREALAKPAQQQPEYLPNFVTNVVKNRMDVWGQTTDAYVRGNGNTPSPQPTKPWVGLTPEQRATIAEANNMLVDDDLFDAIEAELKEKNNG